MQIKAHGQSNKVQKFSHEIKGIITRNAHVKYESSTSNGSKVMAMVTYGYLSKVEQVA